MPAITETKPVEDSIAKVNDEFAVGSDPEFQSKWERFERVVWIVLVIFIGLSFAGVFGRGPIAKAHARASDGSLDVSYERVQRFGTLSLLQITYPGSSVQNGVFRLWVSGSLIKSLGAQRVIPQPAESLGDHDGILYSFPATASQGMIEFATQPMSIGSSEITLRMPQRPEVRLPVFVMP